MRTAQVRAVGTAFLRARPLVVAPIALINAALLRASGAPPEQRVAIASGMAVMLALFVAERAWLRRRKVGERWLLSSLALTVLGLSLACALSGGPGSPFLPLVLAPIVVSFAAFGRGPATRGMLAIAVGAAAALTIAPAPFPPIPAPDVTWMALIAFVGAVALAYAGVGGLSGAYLQSARVLDRMRLSTLEEAASRMRATEQVGAKVAHELKNPLAAIKALLQMALAKEADPRAQKRLGVALSEVNRMAEIVGDYLAFARPLSDLKKERVGLLGIARDVVDVLEARAEKAGVSLSAAGQDPVVFADPRRLREALLNLADNALRATPSGGEVILRVEAEDTEVRVAVEDTGRGLPEIVARDPGAPFVTTREDGTGLGLTLARAAATQHGGNLTLRSRHGGGTIVTLSLPGQLGQPAPPGEP